MSISNDKLIPTMIRFTPSERTTIRMAAALANTSLNIWARQVLSEAAHKQLRQSGWMVPPPPDTPEN
jgi:hypothetical protein